MNKRRALLVGNNRYRHMQTLGSCVRDVRRLAPLLERHGDGAANFQVDKLISTETRITEAKLNKHIKTFFDPKTEERAELLCFYFAGHGAYDYQEASGYLVSYEGEEGDYGVPMEKLIGYANRANADNVMIILDCCHAGAVDNSFATGGLAAPREGVCILAGARDEELAREVTDGGVFTSLLAGALEGGGADPVTGTVTSVNLHAYVDGALGRYDQSPLFKGNVASWCSVRRVPPNIPYEVLRTIIDIFSKPNKSLKLDPSFEPTAKPIGHANEATFGHLQKMRAASLVEPEGEEHMYYAAMNRKSCRLTPMGRYYWMLADRGQLRRS